jgi:hypothetical protein
MSLQAARIKQLCDDFVTAIQQPGGGLVLGAQSAKLRLLSNGIEFHALDYEDAQIACIGLTKVLLHPGLNAIIDNDHSWFWSWAGEILLGGHASSLFTTNSHELRSLFSATVRAATVHVAHADPYVEQIRRKATELIDANAQNLLLNSALVTSYLGFPLLEAVCRAKCSSYVTALGVVTAAFTVPRVTGKQRTYAVGDQCNRFDDLLVLLRDQVGDADLKGLLTEFSQHVTGVCGQDAFAQLQEWRNASLHGETHHQTIGGLLLNLAILLCFHSLAGSYVAARDAAVQRLRQSLSAFRWTGHRTPWEYYPPL